MDRWDPSIDPTHTILSQGDGTPSIELVRAAVERLDEARIVSVEDCRGAPPELRWVTLYEPGDARPRFGGPSSELASGSRRR